jgi:hypothetical protein
MTTASWSVYAGTAAGALTGTPVSSDQTSKPRVDGDGCGVNWRASEIPDTGSNRVRPGMEDGECQNGAGSLRMSSKMRP